MFVRKIVPGISVIALAAFLAVAFSFSRAASSDFVFIGGTAWNPNTGWMFQVPTKVKDYVAKVHGVKKCNRATCVDDRSTEDASDDTEYSLGDVSGWSWSDVYGWICWGATCKDPVLADTAKFGSQLAPPGNVEPFAKVSACECDKIENCPEEKIKLVNGDIKTVKRKLCPTSGWMKIISLKDNGWIRLSHLNPPSGNSYEVKYDDLRREFRGWAWNGTLGWVSFSGKTLYETRRAPPCPRGTRICKGFDIDGREYRACKAKCEQNTETELGCQGDQQAPWNYKGCLEGLTCEQSPTDTVDSGYLCRESATDTSAPAVGSTFTTGRACDPYCDKSVDLKKDDPSSLWKTAFLGTRILTQGGSIYGKTITDAQADYKQDEKNAAREFTMLKSIKDKDDASGKVVRLKSNLGILDIQSLTTKSTNDYLDKAKNKYRQTVYVPGASENPEAALFNFLRDSRTGGQVFFHDGDLTIGALYDPQKGSEHWMVSNGIIVNGKAMSGARTVVIHGNLTIKAPIVYEHTTVTSAKQLASLAWIVYKNPSSKDGGGTVSVDTCTSPSPYATEFDYFTELSGVFIAENTISFGKGEGKECKEAFDTALANFKKEAAAKKVAGRAAWARASKCKDLWKSKADMKERCDKAVAKDEEAKSIAEDGEESAQAKRAAYDAAYQVFLSACWEVDKNDPTKKNFKATKPCIARQEALTKQRAEVEKKEKEAAQKRDEANDAISAYLTYCSLDSDHKDVCEKAKKDFLSAVRLEFLASKHQELSSQFDQDLPVRVNGALFARKIDFKRVYAGVKGGSEIIRNDGRMLVNTPPGLEDFLRSLPAK
ncbi:hypothetical protein HY620_02270 [Candidatus Uhrbacteria bacterium]|nr:hypothetical protein [Candidatus Uhrbacteria bacterium]